MKPHRMLKLLILAALLAGCGMVASRANPSPAALATLAPTGGAPTAAPAAPEPTIAEPTAVQEQATAPVPAADDGGVTAEGYHFLGRADAPATIVMYSDVF